MKRTLFRFHKRSKIDQVKGTSKDIAGKVQEAAGKVIGSDSQQVKVWKSRLKENLKKRLATRRRQSRIRSRSINLARRRKRELQNERLPAELCANRHALVVTRAMLIEGAWEHHFDKTTNFVDVHIRNFRMKIADKSRTSMLQTILKFGYMPGIAG